MHVLCHVLCQVGEVLCFSFCTSDIVPIKYVKYAVLKLIWNTNLLQNSILAGVATRFTSFDVLSIIGMGRLIAD